MHAQFPAGIDRTMREMKDRSDAYRARGSDETCIAVRTRTTTRECAKRTANTCKKCADTAGCMSSPSCETVRIFLRAFRRWHAFRVQKWQSPSRFPPPRAPSSFSSDRCYRGCVMGISTRFRERFTVVPLPFSAQFGRHHCTTTDSSPNAPSPLPPHPCYIRAIAQRQFSTDNRHDFQREYGSATSIRNAIHVFPESLYRHAVHKHLAFGAILKANCRSSRHSSHRYTHACTTTCALSALSKHRNLKHQVLPRHHRRCRHNGHKAPACVLVHTLIRAWFGSFICTTGTETFEDGLPNDSLYTATDSYE